ncbi:MAG: transposase, partial [Clostridia bacterium]|nr:transposase [Clostridia bacterium]
RLLAYFRHSMTNGIAAAINSMIQAAKRKARGYRTFEGYACMIYLVVGKLKLDCTPLFPDFSRF